VALASPIRAIPEGTARIIYQAGRARAPYQNSHLTAIWAWASGSWRLGITESFDEGGFEAVNIEHFRSDGETARVLGGRGGFFSEMCRKCNHQRAVCLYCQIQATHKGTCHACLNRLRHRHHRCSRPWRLLSSRSGRDAATTQTWIERIGRVAFIFACNHLSPTANASPGRSSTGASLLARTLHHGKNSAALAAHCLHSFANRTPGRFAIGGLDCRSVTLPTGMGCGV
jgi:hypothetical protein